MNECTQCNFDEWNINNSPFERISTKIENGDTQTHRTQSKQLKRNRYSNMIDEVDQSSHYKVKTNAV